MVQPKVAIHIPTYNQADIIYRAIESSLSQNYENLDIIISDDASDDNTEDIIKKYLNDNRVKYFRNKINIGRVANYRKLLTEYSSADWVVNLDGDDYYIDENFISRAIEAIYTNGKEDVVLYLAQNRLMRKVAQKMQAVVVNAHLRVDGVRYLKHYAGRTPFCHFAAIYKRKAALAKDFFTKECLAADYLSIMQLADLGKFIITDKIIGVWEVSKTSASQALNSNKMLENIDGIKNLINNINFPDRRIELRVLNNLIFGSRLDCTLSEAKSLNFFKGLKKMLLLANSRPYYWKELGYFIYKKILSSKVASCWVL